MVVVEVQDVIDARSTPLAQAASSARQGLLEVRLPIAVRWTFLPLEPPPLP